MELQIKDKNTVVIKSGYTEAQKRAIYKYRQGHKEKMAELNKKYYDQKKDTEE